MLHQIVYTAITFATLAAIALPVGATRQGCDDYANPLCVPFGAADERDGDTIRGSGRAKVLPQ